MRVNYSPVHTIMAWYELFAITCDTASTHNSFDHIWEDVINCTQIKSTLAALDLVGLTEILLIFISTWKSTAFEKDVLVLINGSNLLRQNEGNIERKGVCMYTMRKFKM
jgi:hypothetical protein